MNIWYQCSARYTKEMPDGTLKRITEHYLFSAVSFTDAETAIHKQIGELVRGEFKVTSIKEVSFADIYAYDDAEIWWNVKISIEIEDESGKTKPQILSFMVDAHTITEACQRITEKMKDIMSTFEIISATRTKIVDVYAANPEKE